MVIMMVVYSFRSLTNMDASMNRRFAKIHFPKKIDAVSDLYESLITIIMIMTMIMLFFLLVWIDVPPQDNVALVGETAELECKSRGVPTPVIMWKKNYQPIHFPSNPRYAQKSTGSLQISRSQKGDSGKYTCVVTNSVGSKSANATLTVWSK